MEAALHYFEVFWSVIGLDLVLMVHDFILGDWPTEHLGHHKGVFAHIAALIRIRVSWTANESVARFPGDISPIFPTGVVCSTPRAFWSSHDLILSR